MVRRGRRFWSQDTLAVSAVISVILLVAITVVLSATVFVLVSNLNQGGQSSGPKLSIVSDSATSAVQWKLKVTDSITSAPLSDYQFVLTTSTHGVIVITLDNTSFQPVNAFADTTTATGTSRTDATTSAFAVSQTGYRISFQDASGNEKFDTLDQVTVTYDSSVGSNDFTASLVSGNYRFDVRHIPSDSSSAFAKNTF